MNLSVSDLAQLYRNQGREVPPEFQGRPELEARLRAHKYGAIKKQVDGITFDSTSEAEAYGVLKLWEAAGAIIDLELQPVFVLQEKFVEEDADGKRKTHRAIKYIADFSFRTPASNRFMAERVIVDVKGILTPAFRIKENYSARNSRTWIFKYGTGIRSRSWRDDEHGRNHAGAGG